MPRKKRVWTLEQKRIQGEKIKALWATKRGETELTSPVETTEQDGALPINIDEQQDPLSGPQPEETPTMLANQDVEELKRQVEELKATLGQVLARPQPSSHQGQLTQRGIVGTVDRYRMDRYPDPRNRLAIEPKLKRFAFNQNFELSWLVAPARYQTIDGVWQREPQFTLELWRKMLDEDTGEDTQKRFVICRGIFFEDPEAAVIVAQENGLSVDETNEELFLNEMRYIRMRDWLLETFYPPKPTQAKSNKREMVIGNKLVEVFEVNSETPETINFSQLKNKL